MHFEKKLFSILYQLLKINKCNICIDNPNDQLQFSLLKMGQVEILGGDRKRSRKKGAKRDQFQLVPNNMTTTVNKHKIVYSTKHALASTHVRT